MMSSGRSSSHAASRSDLPTDPMNVSLGTFSRVSPSSPPQLLNTTTSPRDGPWNQYAGLQTSTRSLQTNVVSIDPDGMKNVWTSSARTRVITSSVMPSMISTSTTALCLRLGLPCGGGGPGDS